MKYYFTLYSYLYTADNDAANEQVEVVSDLYPTKKKARKAAIAAAASILDADLERRDFDALGTYHWDAGCGIQIDSVSDDAIEDVKIIPATAERRVRVGWASPAR